MAEPLPSSLSEFQQQFDDQLKCSVCLDQYTNPKTPCLHSFCLKCIEPLPVEIKVTTDTRKFYNGCVTNNLNYTQFIHDTCTSYRNNLLEELAGC